MIIKKLKDYFISKESRADTFGNISYPFIVGALVDFASGLRGIGIITTRTSGVWVNAATGTTYGKYRNFLYEKTSRIKKNPAFKKALEGIIRNTGIALAQISGANFQAYPEIAYHLVESEKIQDSLTDLVAFNTFQVPLYAGMVVGGSFVENLTHGQIKVNLSKVANGAKNLASLSPLIGPAMGWYMDKCRKFLGTKSASEKTREQK